MPFTSKRSIILFPAYAGVILMDYLNRYYQWPFPRLRGGDPLIEATCDILVNFSPPTWG